MLSTIHEVTTVNTGWKDRKTNMEIKKPYAVFQYNKFMKCVDRAVQCLSFYSAFAENCKMDINLVLYLLNCVFFNAFFVYRTLNTNIIK
jgi:hypothetical protein